MANLIYEGQLMKKGKINKSWKNRWCIMSEINGYIYLSYYDSKIDQNLCGTIEFAHVYDIKMVHSSDYDLSFLGSIPSNIRLTNEIKTETKYSFIIYTTKRKWIFAAFDPKNFLKWLAIFDKYIYNGILKRGFLEKRGEKNTGWKRRYFVLNQHKQLKYYTDESCKKWLGNIPLNEIVKIQHHKDKDYTFHLITEKRIWILCAPTLDDRREWIELVNKWRTAQVHHPTFSLIDDIKETWNNIDIMEEVSDIDMLSNSTVDTNSKYKKRLSIENEGRMLEREEVEEWKCASCQQIYATFWPKCPGCLRSNTHYVYYMDQSQDI